MTDVQENITKVGKQIEHGETRLASLLVLAAPDLTDEDGLPIVDIREELDEEDNVVGQLLLLLLLYAMVPVYSTITECLCLCLQLRLSMAVTPLLP